MWNISRASYYADFITIPILGCVAAVTDVLYHGCPSLTAGLMFGLGVLLWTLAEYVLHRKVFHRMYRREHWIHHIRPAAFIGVPAWQSSGAFLMILGACWGSLGLDLGAGLFCGFAAGYWTYIWAHDQFHHGRLKPGTYWHRRYLAHKEHHDSGKEVNFGVVTGLWDVLLDTTPESVV